MELLVVGIGLAAIAGFIIFIRWHSRVTEWGNEINSAFVSIGVDQKYWRPKHTYTSPKGIRIRSVRPLPPEAIQEIDNGVGNQIRLYTAENPEWTAYAKHSDYDVYVIKPMTTNMDGSPAMFVKGYQSAGTMLGASQRYGALDKRPVVVIVDQVDQNWGHMVYFRHSAHAESEHAREWVNLHNNPTGRFYYWVGVGDTHPHTHAGWGDEEQGLLASEPIPCVMPDKV